MVNERGGRTFAADGWMSRVGTDDGVGWHAVAAAAYPSEGADLEPIPQRDLSHAAEAMVLLVDRDWVNTAALRGGIRWEVRTFRR